MNSYNMQNRQARADFKYSEELLDLLREAVSEKKGSIAYYGNVANLAIIKDEREVLLDIHMDEQKHLKILTNICRALAGEYPDAMATEYPISRNIVLEYQKSILDELEAVEFYRKIYLGCPNIEIRDMLFEIITDEQAHAAKLNFLCVLRKV